MASSFRGWGSSWAQTWERVSNPNAMYGSASISFSASGTLTAVTQQTESPEQLKYYAIEQPKHEGQVLMAQALEEDEILLAMLHVLVEEL